MMSAAETRFREIESLLDRQLLALRSATAFGGTLVRDLSARGYHYKNQVLAWSHQFVRDTPRDGEIERVSVFLTYIEPHREGDDLMVVVRSEIFSQGCISRIDRRREYATPMEKVRTDGFGPILETAFAQGAELLV